MVSVLQLSDCCCTGLVWSSTGTQAQLTQAGKTLCRSSGEAPSLRVSLRRSLRSPQGTHYSVAYMGGLRGHLAQSFTAT